MTGRAAAINAGAGEHGADRDNPEDLQDSKNAAGSPSVHAKLVLGHGMTVGRNRVAALMKAANLVGAHRRKRRGLTRQDKKAPPAPD